MKVKVGDCKKGLQPLVFFCQQKFFLYMSTQASSKELVNTEGLIPGHGLRLVDFVLYKGHCNK